MLVRGLLMILAGAVFLAAPLMASVVAGIAMGATLVFLGAVTGIIALAVREPGWGWALARGLFAVIAGVLFLFDPGSAVIGLALALGAYFAVSGVMRAGLALAWRPAQGWGWMFASGLLGLLLAGIVLAGWPLSSFYIVGTLLGVEALIDGVAHVTLGAAPDARILPPTELPRVQR
jgi:uncharacterized membrane protein HdeD (DUF308 family)